MFIKQTQPPAILSRQNSIIAFVIFSVAFLATFVASSMFAPTGISDATTVTAAVHAGEYSIDITSHDVTIDAVTTATGAASFRKDTVTTQTNAPTGYKLYVSMAGNESNNLYQDGNSASSNFISPTTGTFSVPDTLSMNSWGVSTAAITTGGENTFWSMPLLASPQLIQTTSTANEAGTEKDIYFGIKANLALSAGSYSNSILYTATANADTAGASAFTISPSSTTSLTGGDEVTIITTLMTNYQMTNDNATVTIDNKTCPVTSIYTDTSSGTVAIKCNTPILSKYGTKSVYVKIDPFEWEATLTSGYTASPAFWNIAYMQDMNSEVCNSVYTPSNVTGSSAIIRTKANMLSGQYTATANGTNQVPETTLTDKRDNSTYTVRKLADGNCWMAENLKLTLTNNQAIRVGTFSGGETTWTPNQDTSSSNPYNIAISQNTKANVNGGNWYYPWYAATAGQGTNTANPTINRSICPKGWRLPGGDTSNPSFYRLITTIYGVTNNSTGSTKVQSAPLSFYYAGNYISGRPGDTTTYGFYWSASPYTDDSSYAYHFNFGDTVVFPQNHAYAKPGGFSVRCVAIP